MAFRMHFLMAALVARMKKLSSEETLRTVGTRNSPFEEDCVGKDVN